jgi:hypothetical protein
MGFIGMILAYAATCKSAKYCTQRIARDAGMATLSITNDKRLMKQDAS